MNLLIRDSSKKQLSRPTILLLGTGRSGTTWLAGLLAKPFRYRLLFEPFMPHHVPNAEYIADCYYGPDNIPVSVKEFCCRALNDEIDSAWIAQSSNRKFNMHRWRFWPKVRICKDIRSNLFVPSYKSIFGDELPIVVLMRHPGAVVESFLRVRFPWAFDISQLLQQESFAQIYNIPLSSLRTYTDSDVGKIMVRWVMENVYLLENADDLGISIVFYEDLVTNPAQVVETLCVRLDIECATNLSKLVNEASYTTHPRSPLHSGHYRTISSWKERLSAENIQTITQILDIAQVHYPCQMHET